MFSKLNCYKFQTITDDRKESKFQKYLRERNEKLVEKCFYIKIEKTVDKNSESKQQLQETNNEKLPSQCNEKQSCQQTCENISITSANPRAVISQQDAIKPLTATETSQNKRGKTINSHSSQVTQSVESSNKKHSTAARCLSSCNRSSNSKHLGDIPSQRRSATSSNWKSPFNSFTTSGVRNRLQRSQQSSEFSYDLSRDELKFSGHFRGPMRPAPEAERQLLNSGQRREYLVQRYEHAPVVKYNYPEATSWRIGWLQQKQ